MNRLDGNRIIDRDSPGAANIKVLLDGKLVGPVERVNPGGHYVDVWEQWVPPLEPETPPIWQLVHKTGYVVVFF